ncbi:GNAT family N-acetyltransferase [Terracoccus luteus]|uniref:N-acetyltransferase domain-containing protein n=1 Tax=Terracoccus luteus TaxID=53356 RepID=A0A839Q1Q1_9MICO|nr:GNAT family N-acetyltransferase [Terracoccus luteus]MBB2988235.1 hypothetical protein [Terracoccus luteus]MCP2173870.1 hypothetical protein [Terracoccus luteus]
MSADAESLVYADAPQHGRWEVRDGERLVGQARYVVIPPDGSDGTPRAVFFHTEVADDLEGQGVAGRLVTAALDATVAAGQVIVPVCPYVAAFVRRHAEQYGDHVSAPTPADLDAARAA